MASGKYKDKTDVGEHVRKLKEGLNDLQGKTQALKNAIGKKARDLAKAALKDVIKDVKGHVKDLVQKPPAKSGD